jgi:hypothetical protein
MLVSFTDVSLTNMTGIIQKIIVSCRDAEMQAKVYAKAKAEPDYTKVYRSQYGSKVRRRKDCEFTELTDEEFLNQC